MFIRYIVGSTATALLSNIWWVKVSPIYIPALQVEALNIHASQYNQDDWGEPGKKMYVPSAQLDRRLTW
jgi:hypothetical protein